MFVIDVKLRDDRPVYVVGCMVFLFNGVQSINRRTECTIPFGTEYSPV